MTQELRDALHKRMNMKNPHKVWLATYLAEAVRTWSLCSMGMHAMPPVWRWNWNDGSWLMCARCHTSQVLKNCTDVISPARSAIYQVWLLYWTAGSDSRP